MKLLDEYILQAGQRGLIIKESRTRYHTNREFKDGMFRLLFREKRAALELLNALEGTSETGEEKLKIETLEEALYNHLLNDLAFQYDYRLLSIVEHMSTWSDNMPIRDLLYLGRTYEKILPNEEVHREAQQKILVPHLYVLYNGVKEKPLESTQRLSDAFAFEEKDRMAELRVKVININYHKRHPILERKPDIEAVRPIRGTGAEAHEMGRHGQGRSDQGQREQLRQRGDIGRFFEETRE